MAKSSQTSALQYAALTPLVALCAVFAASGGNAQPAAAMYVPFTAQIVEESFGNSAAVKPATVQNIVYGRQSNGSEASFTSVHSPDNQQTAELVYILDVNSRKEIQLEPFTKSSMTFYLSEEQLTQSLDSRHCPTNFDALTEHSKILNYDVVRYRDNSGSSAESPTDDIDDEWIAPRLACFVLKDIFTVSSGPWNRRTVVSLTEGEPASSMFSIPSEYVERSPSEINTAWRTIFPGTEFLPDASVRTVEQRYYRERRGP
jgi:hypothetical protein